MRSLAILGGCSPLRPRNSTPSDPQHRHQRRRRRRARPCCTTQLDDTRSSSKRFSNSSRYRSVFSHLEYLLSLNTQPDAPHRHVSRIHRGVTTKPTFFLFILRHITRTSASTARPNTAPIIQSLHHHHHHHHKAHHTLLRYESSIL